MLIIMATALMPAAVLLRLLGLKRSMRLLHKALVLVVCSSRILRIWCCFATAATAAVASAHHGPPSPHPSTFQHCIWCSPLVVRVLRVSGVVRHTQPVR